MNAAPPAAEQLRDTISTGIANRLFYIAQDDELSCLWLEAAAASESDRFDVLEAFAEENGWSVTPQRNLTGALFQLMGREVFSPGIWRAVAQRVPAERPRRRRLGC